MKKPVTLTTAVVLTPRGQIPYNREACFSDPDPGGKKPVLVLVDPVILDLDKDCPAGAFIPARQA